MKPEDFVHLHVHSDYSLLDGVAQVPDLVKEAKRCNQTALALTDHGTVSGALQFHKAAEKEGVKPILGCEVYLAKGKMTERKRGYNHLTILAKNDVGWKNLSKITSMANLEGFYYRPRVDFETLAAHSEGLVVLSGCLKGPVPVQLVKDEYGAAKESAGQFREVFGDDFYLEVQPNSLEQQKVVNTGCLKLAKELGIRSVATCDLHYIQASDAPAQEVRICIASGKTLSDQNRLKMKEDFFFRSSEQMSKAFTDVPEAILATREIAEKVTGYDLMPGARNEYYLPKFATPDGSDPDDYFDRCCEEGLKRRYRKIEDVHRERLEYEKGVIRTLGFITYFLIVADFINWARENDCAVGPGRGSAAGSIVAYVLGITDIDPLRYDLLFERFLNPERVSMPDIDVDFCEANRGRVIEYVRETYGAANVCQIVTFGTLKPKAVIKDVGRVLEIPYSEVDKISKLIPEGPKLKSLDQAFREEPRLQEMRHRPPYDRLFDLAQRLEGINRHMGKHAAGVVIADQDLIERIPLTAVKGDKTTAFTMTEVEECGLLKMDFLGLRTLTLIEEALALLRKRGIELDLDAAPLDDQKTFEMLSRGDSAGVFQLESSGFRKLLKQAKPDRFEDIIALIALYRPGPLGSEMDQTYIRRKHEREPIAYLTPLLEPILGETYGCILYQEQVMRIANQIAGFSMADADVLRKAMGKKKIDLMEKFKPAFVEGFEAKGVAAKVAEEVWSQIAFFAEYGFNKCVVGETVVVDARTGERTTVGDLHARRRPFTLHALGDDWRLRPRAVLDVVRNGPRPVFELRTKQGKRIVATGNHPLRTLDGWTHLGDLRPGDLIAAPASSDASSHSVRVEPVRHASGVAVLEKPQLGTVSGDVVWDEVAAIEPRGVQETYDLEIDQDHNFVADGLIVHNSHSAAYGLVTYRTAYLKAHYPAEFMAATLTSWMGDTDRVLDYKTECDRMGLELVPPDVNTSQVKFDVLDNKITYGLGAIKGIGKDAAAHVVATREREDVGRFRSLFHFCSEVDCKRALTKAAVETLVKAGAFDSLGHPRRRLHDALDQAIQIGIQEQKDRMSQQIGLFGVQAAGEDLDKIDQGLLSDVGEWETMDLLQHEKAAIGFYLTQHPLDQHKEVLERYSSHDIGDLDALGEKEVVTVGALIVGLRTLLDRKGNTMAFLTLEDFSGTCDGVVFGSVFSEIHQHLHEENVVFVQGKVNRRNGEASSILVDRVLGLDQAEGRLRVSLSAELVLEDTSQDQLREFRELLMKHRGDDPVYYTFVRRADDSRAGPFRVGSHFRVTGSETLRDALQDLLGPTAQVRLGAIL